MSETMELQPTVVRTDRGLSVNGTRITLYSIMDYVTAGWPPKLIRDYLNLTDRQISDVITYIAEHRAEVEAEYRQVLEEAEEERRYWEAYNQERFARIAALPPRPELEAVREKIAATRTKSNDR